MRRRSFLLLAGSLGLSGCSMGPGEGGPYSPYSAGGATSGPESLAGLGAGQGASGPVAILLPFSGRYAAVAEPMFQAAELALSGPGAPPLLKQDTGGTPQGAAAAVQAALRSGARLILGPLTAPETNAAASVAAASGVPMLAFTNDPAVARPGVWTLGITPGEQVRNLVGAAQRQGRTRFAALLPDSAFGRLMAQALADATRAAALPPPAIRFHSGGMASINQTARALSDYAGRWGPIERKMREARASGTAAGRREAAALRKSVPPPPPFDALLLADTGVALEELSAVLAYYVVGPPSVRIMGPALWADPASGSRHLPGAWFVQPASDSRAGFVSAYTQRYGNPPPGIADLAYDAGGLALVAARAGYGADALTQARGFSGADGWLVLLADGHVRRGLGVFAVGGPSGPRLVQPPPVSPGAAV
ncbi:MAG: penicillin-binding protein activator [Rhodospirillales bacterium]|nr:penicillin-binding protein activator [Rhodospirillales bacterium]